MSRPPTIVRTAVTFIDIIADMKANNDEPLTENEQVTYDSALHIANLYFLGEIMDAPPKPADLPSET